MKRYGMVIRLRPGAEEEYRRHHAAAWPPVLEMIRQCNIRNYSIYLRNGTLFSYFEYCGTDFAADMAKMAADPVTQQWWAIMEPLQEPLADRKPGEWWAEMDEVFHFD
jgi:L-rhamnose mutarotase